MLAADSHGVHPEPPARSKKGARKAGAPPLAMLTPVHRGARRGRGVELCSTVAKRDGQHSFSTPPGRAVACQPTASNQQIPQAVVRLRWRRQEGDHPSLCALTTSPRLAG